MATKTNKPSSKKKALAYEDVATQNLRAFIKANKLSVKLRQEGGYANGRPDATFIRGRAEICGFDAKKLIKEGDGCQPTRYTVKKEGDKLVPTEKTTSRDDFETDAFEKIQENVRVFAKTRMKTGATEASWVYVAEDEEDEARFAALDPDQKEAERKAQEQCVLSQFVAEDYARKCVDYIIFGKDASFVSPATAADMLKFSTFKLTVRFIRRGTQDIPKRGGVSDDVLAAFGFSSDHDDVSIERGKGITISNISKHGIPANIVSNMEPTRNKNSKSLAFTASNGKSIEILIQFDRAANTLNLKKRGEDTQGSETSVVIVEEYLGDTTAAAAFGADKGWDAVLEACREFASGNESTNSCVVVPGMETEKKEKHELFMDVATRRAMEAARKIEMLGKCADPARYEYSKEEARIHLERLTREIEEAERQFL